MPGHDDDAVLRMDRIQQLLPKETGREVPAGAALSCLLSLAQQHAMRHVRETATRTGKGPPPSYIGDGDPQVPGLGDVWRVRSTTFVRLNANAAGREGTFYISHETPSAAARPSGDPVGCRRP